MDIVRKRISVRTFTDEPVDVVKVQELIDEVNNKSGLSFTLMEDGSHAFADMEVHYGMFRNVKNLVVLKAKKDTEDLLEKVGYYGEELILELTKFNIATCWVGGTYSKELFNVDEDEVLLSVVPIGVFDESKHNPNIREIAGGKRKTIDERLTTDSKIENWIKDAMESVCYAPSAKHSQKPHVSYLNGEISIAVEYKSPVDLIDLGIAKKHFELSNMGKFELGNPAKFILNDEK